MDYYQELLRMYLNYCENNTPIFIEEIKTFFKGLSRNNEEFEITVKKVHVNINRLIRK